MAPRYIRSLDGVRAVACLLVLSDHLGYTGFGGWVGVQLFFVLSGFLITGILLEYKEKAINVGAYLKTFYTRRALRIFPVYYLFVFLMLATSRIWGWPEASPRSWLYLLTYTFNFAALDPKISAAPPPQTVMNHTWSLSLEEQFYLVWPILVFVTSRRLLKRTSIAIVLIAPLVRVLVEMVAFSYFTRIGESTPHILASLVTYEFPLSQVDAFAFGALIVLVDLSWITRPKRAFWIAMGATLVFGAVNALILVSQHVVSRMYAIHSLGYPGLLDKNFQYVWGYSLIDLLAMLLVLACTRNEPVFRWLESSVMVRVGKISYGIYLFHRPIYKFAIQYFPYDVREQPRALIISAALLAIIYGVSEASYRLFETRFLKMKERATLEVAPSAARRTEVS